MINYPKCTPGTPRNAPGRVGMIAGTLTAIKAAGKQHPGTQTFCRNRPKPKLASATRHAPAIFMLSLGLGLFAFCLSVSLPSFLFHPSSSPHSTRTTRGTSALVLPTRPARHWFPHSGHVSSSLPPSPIPSSTAARS